MRLCRPHSLLAFFCLFGLIACSSEEVRSAPWESVAAPDLSPRQLAQLEEARLAKAEMMKALLAALSDEMSARGPSAAISVCKEQAPRIAEAVGAAHGLRIGRTSHRLRNPSNVAPAWAESLLSERSAEARFSVSSEGTLGVTFPIHLKPQCLVCHGPEDYLMQEVREALAENYPDDRATGFAEGDLRGWFWVEVPGPTD